MKAWLPLLMATALAASAHGLGSLPEWARTPAGAPGEAPAGADAWVLLQRTEVSYRGDGGLRVKQFRLVRVLGERGLREANFILGGRAGDQSRVRRLKGWNLRPDGEVAVLDADLTVTRENEQLRETRTLLPRATKGSLLAFEAEQDLKDPQWPTFASSILEDVPVRRWELEVKAAAPAEARLDLVNAQPWLAAAAPAGGRLFLDDLPALPEETQGIPHPIDFVPTALVRVLDPGLKPPSALADWDRFARSHYALFSAQVAPAGAVPAAAGTALERLRALTAWIGREVIYRQLYLAPDRGWVPERGPETLRKRYGDCKDYACLLIGEAKALGLEGFPVLARIVDGHLPADPPVYPGVFNHVIVALRLPVSLGLPAEVETPRGRFLLVDPTDRSTPVGWLGEAHRGRRLLICTDQGGLWLTVADAALLRPRIRFELEGRVDSLGELTGDLRIEETGDALGLRQLAREAGPVRLADHLRSLLGIPVNARLDLVQPGEPLALDRPLKLAVRFQLPEAMAWAAGEAHLAALGWPAVPAVLQKPGTPRRLPVEREAWLDWEVTARLGVPWRVEPVLPERTGASAFRRFTWTARATPEGSGSRLDLRLQEEACPARFGWDALAQGAAEWKRDRSAVLALRADGLAFKAPAKMP